MNINVEFRYNSDDITYIRLLTLNESDEKCYIKTYTVKPFLDKNYLRDILSLFHCIFIDGTCNYKTNRK